jgi:hypothetical protein
MFRNRKENRDIVGLLPPLPPYTVDLGLVSIKNKIHIGLS